MKVPTELFISHSSADSKFVEKLVETLRNHHIPVWYSSTNIHGAQQWHDEIGAALNRCDWFLLILSPNSVDSMWVKRELMYALQQNRFENKIIPLIFEPCDPNRLSWVLRSLQMIKFESDYDSLCSVLLKLWGKPYVPPAP